MDNGIEEPQTTQEFNTPSTTVHSEEFSSAVGKAEGKTTSSQATICFSSNTSSEGSDVDNNSTWETVLTGDELSPRQEIEPSPKRNKVKKFLKPVTDGECETPEPVSTPIQAQPPVSPESSPLNSSKLKHIENDSPWSQSSAGDSFDSADSSCSQPLSYRDEFERLYDKDNKMSYNRFLKTRRVRRLIKSNAMKRDSVHELYCIYDKDNDGDISMAEYVELMDIINLSYEEHINAVELSDSEDEIHNMPGGSNSTRDSTPSKTSSSTSSNSPGDSPIGTNVVDVVVIDTTASTATQRSSLNSEMLLRLSSGNYSTRSSASKSANHAESEPEHEPEPDENSLPGPLFSASPKKGFLLKKEKPFTLPLDGNSAFDDASMKENASGNKRFFTLDDGVLTYYDHVANTQGLLKRDIVLKDAKLNVASHNIFEIQQANSSKYVSLEVKNLTERDEWVAAIREHIELSRQ